MSTFILDESTGGSGDSGPQFHTVNGLLRKSFIAAPAKEDSKYPDALFYLPFVPELDAENKSEQAKFAPPKTVPGMLYPVQMFDVGFFIKGDDTKLPYNLSEVPVAQGKDADNTIDRAIKQGRYNFSEETGRPKRSKKYAVLMYRVDGDNLPEPTVMHLGPKQMSELCTQLQTHRKYVKDLVGVPMRILKTQEKTTFVDVDVESERLDPAVMKITDENGVFLLDTYLQRVRSVFETWLLEHGWQATTDPETGANTDFREAAGMFTPPWDTTVTSASSTTGTATVTTEVEPNGEHTDMTKESLRDLLTDSGIDAPSKATKAELTEMAAGAGLL